MLVATLPPSLRPRSDVDLVRVGPVGDGGYVVARDVVPAITWVVGLGMADDWRFEAELAATAASPVTVCDPGAGPRFWARRRVGQLKRRITGAPVDPLRDNPVATYRKDREFFGPGRENLRVRIGDGRTGTVALAEVLNRHPDRDVFLKIDVEGGEWQTLDTLLAQQHRIVGAAIGFHDVDEHLDLLLGFVQRAESWSIVNVAANNAGGVAHDGTPRLVEMSFARTDLLRPGTTAARKAPALNGPNTTRVPPVEIQFAETGASDIIDGRRPEVAVVARPGRVGDDHERLVLCVPRNCGLNDILVQVWRSYQFAELDNRRLLIDTRLSALWGDLGDYLDADSTASVPIVTRVSDDDIRRLNTLTCNPADRTGRVDFLYTEARLRTRGTTHSTRWGRVAAFARDIASSTEVAQGHSLPDLRRRLSFAADSLRLVGRDHDIGDDRRSPAQLVIHHRTGGGTESLKALRLFTFTAPVRAAVTQALHRCGDDFDALHIRNTDMASYYEPMLQRARTEFAGRRVLVCSDDAAVIERARAVLSDSEVFTVTDTEDTNGAPLHKVAARRSAVEQRRLAVNMFVDLMCLAHSSALRVAPARDGGLSGYSRLAQLLKTDAATRESLLDPPAAIDLTVPTIASPR